MVTKVGPSALGEVLNSQLMNAPPLGVDLTKHDRRIGARDGYVGYEGGSLLNRPLPETPQQVIFFPDEIEKSNPDVFVALAKVLDEAAVDREDTKGSYGTTKGPSAY